MKHRGCGRPSVNVKTKKSGENKKRGGRCTTGNQGRNWRRKYGRAAADEEREKDKFSRMCLSSFSIYREVLFIRLKSIIYAAAGKKRNNVEILI